MIESIWYEKYAPQTIDDVILPENVKNKFKKYISDGKLPNLGFWSSEPGLGKSSTAKALIRSMNADALFVNASMERGIDVLKSKIMNFASTESLTDSPKIVVMDECDNMTKDVQASWRGFIDSFHGNCSFIFTGNYKSKIIEPLLDRLENYEFVQFPKEEMVKPIFEKLKYIAQKEELSFDDKQIGLIIKEYYPRIRGMIGALQRSAQNGQIVLQGEGSDFSDVISEMKAKNYLGMVEKVNALPNPDAMYEFLYKNLGLFQKLPNAIVTIAKYQYQNGMVRDKNLNLSACLTELTACL